MLYEVMTWGVTALLVLGGLFGLVGSFGLLKLRDPMQRLHAPTKATTVGVGTALVASSLDLVIGGGPLTLHEVLVACFLLVTAPLSAFYLARLIIHRNLGRSDLPPSGTGRDWAVFEADAKD